MTDNGKKLAVFIPCYNASATLADTLRTVELSIAELGLPAPVYLYDDCSTDDSLAIARNTWKNRETLIIKQNEQNLGERRTTNKAFDQFYGKYDWVFIIHADDIAKAGWLKEMYAQISQANDAECFTVWSSFDSLDNGSGRVTPGDNTGQVAARDRSLPEKLQYITQLYSNWHLSGAALNVSLFQRLSGFDETMAQFGDTDFFTRGLLAGYRDIYLSRTLTYYRVAGNSVSSTSVRTNRDIREILYMVTKFGTKLQRPELRKLYKTLANLSFRRGCRSLLRVDIVNFCYAGRVTMHAYSRFFLSYL